MCFGCVEDGSVSEAVFLKTEALIEAWPDIDYGPAHIVLADYNMEDHHIKRCLVLIDAILTQDASRLAEDDREWVLTTDWWQDPADPQLTVARDYLTELLAIPETERVPVLAMEIE